ncbi:hypothetical protein LXL04_020161 [Taraxacum kok-saghyz]
MDALRRVSPQVRRRETTSKGAASDVLAGADASKFINKSHQKEENALVVEHVMFGDDSDDEEDNIGGRGEDRVTEVEVRELSEIVWNVGVSSSCRKRKSAQLNLIDDDTDDEVDFFEDDDHNGNVDDELLPI